MEMSSNIVDRHYKGMSRSDFEQMFSIPDGIGLVEHAKILAQFLHGDEVRRTGQPYVNHLEEVVQFADSILHDELWGGSNKESSIKAAALAAAWLHDSVENNKSFLDVFNPFRHYRDEEILNDHIYLNDLFDGRGQRDERMCYMVFGMTNRGFYGEYIDNLFRIKENYRLLDIAKLIVKACDRRSNSAHGEIWYTDDIAKEYMGLSNASREDLTAFYKKLGILEIFQSRAGDAYHLTALIQSLQTKMNESAEGNSLDNVFNFIPRMERLLIVPHLETGHEIFSPQALRKLLVDLYVESLKTLDSLAHEDLTRPIIRTMYYRGLQKTSSYTPIVEDAAERFIAWKRQK
jgi:hypothetical protein